jgi:hypothetical protein
MFFPRYFSEFQKVLLLYCVLQAEKILERQARVGQKQKNKLSRYHPLSWPRKLKS